MAKTNKTPKAEDNAELRTISLLKILNTYSDENHELSTKNIMDKLQKECGVMNCTPFVRQYDIMSNRWGDFNAKGYTKQTIHTGI